MAMAGVLARCSAPSRVCSIAGSRKVDGAHRFGCRMRICVLCGQAWRSPCILELHAPLTTLTRVGHAHWATVPTMTTPRSRSNLAVVGLLASLIVTLGCSATVSKSQVVPTWQSHAYRAVLISAPSSWHVYLNAVCTPNKHPGALALGAANGPGTCED